MGNTIVTPVSSPESRECPSDDFNDAYIELGDDFIAEAQATRDAKAVKELLARHAIYYIIKTTNNQWPGFNNLVLQCIND
jgi:hypothetical protein